MLASMEGHTEVVGVLLNAGLKVNDDKNNVCLEINISSFIDRE